MPRGSRKLRRMNSSLLSAARFAACFVGCCIASSWAQPPKTPVYYPMPSTGSAPLPFSEAVQLGDTLYVSGQVGNQPGTRTLAPGGLGPESKQALENMKAVLERHGTSLDHVVKCTVFLADIKEWPAFNEIYQTFFNKNLPARSALAASGLANGARVEVECIAFVPQKIN